MDLARHAAVLWRFRAVTALGLFLGLFLAVLASYRVTTTGLVPRGAVTFSSQSQLLVTQAGFPEGRVVLPTGPVLGSTTEQPKVDPNRIEFADPNRFMSLADLYTKLIVSDEVRSRIPERPSEAQITASPLPAVSGAPILPIIQLITLSDTAAGAQRLNANTARALRGLLEQRQLKNNISPAQSVQISTLNAPSRGVMTSGRSHTASILALMLCLVGTIAVTHLLASLRPAPLPEQFDDAAFDWALEEHAAGDVPELEPPVAPGDRYRR
jgi:hypothetical protein